MPGEVLQVRSCMAMESCSLILLFERSENFSLQFKELKKQVESKGSILVVFLPTLPRLWCHRTINLEGGTEESHSRCELTTSRMSRLHQVTKWLESMETSGQSPHCASSFLAAAKALSNSFCKAGTRAAKQDDHSSSLVCPITLDVYCSAGPDAQMFISNIRMRKAQMTCR